MRVLIVDDDLDFAETLQDILEPRGFSVCRVTNTADAHREVIAFKPQVALIDLRLGKENGVELIGALRAIQTDLVCIMMTAFADLESAIKAMQDGAYDYLRKPLNSPDLLAKLDRVFERIAMQAARELAETELEQRSLELAEFNRRLQLLVRSATTISACTDLGHFPMQLMIECALSLNTKQSAFYVIADNSLNQIVSLGENQFPDEIILPLSANSELYRVVAYGECLHLPDIGETSFALQNEFGLREGSVLILPLLSSARSTQALVLLHNPANGAFTANDRELGILLASLSAEVFHTLETGEALRQSEYRFRTLLQNLPGVVLRCERDANLTLLYASDKLQLFTGLSKEDVFNSGKRSLLALVHEEDRPRIRDLLEQPVQYDTPFEIDVRLKHLSGNVRWVTVRGMNIPAPDPARAWIDCALFDITERVEAQEAQRQLEGHVRHLQKLESLGVLAGGIAHDFNNLMVPIMGYADMLLEDFSDNDFARESLLEIQQAVERARDLVQQILTFSRQSETEKLPTQMHLVVRQALKLLRSSLPSTIEIVDRIDRYTGMVLANPTQLHQVVMNIGTNAFHAMEEHGGKLEISLCQVTVDSWLAQKRPLLVEGERYAALEIHDTGVGMTEDTMSRIFDPFFTTKEPGKGTGLGLATTHGIISGLKGDIWANSSPGRGSTFHIYLPIVEYTGEVDEKSLDQIATGRGERILVIDDDTTILDMARLMVPMLGYTVETASDSAEALRTIEADPDKYLLILTDYTMPKKTGLDVAQEVRALRPNLPIILASGHGDLIPKKRLEELKINNVLPKPYKIRDLATCIQSALQTLSGK